MFNPKRTTTKHSNAKPAEKRLAKDANSSDKFSAVAAQADRAFKRAAKDAVAENDALGIATHGARRGKLIVRAPIKRHKAALA